MRMLPCGDFTTRLSLQSVQLKPVSLVRPADSIPACLNRPARVMDEVQLVDVI
jgi:hypothetical protein